jgi:hypothetical protein
MLKRFIIYLIPSIFILDLHAQSQNKLWHGIEREIHYKPEGRDFLLASGKRRFNRALYGGNTAFRAEAGDLPEFALYLPGMGGNLKFGLIKNEKSKWLIDADHIETRYRPGSMIYKIRDALLGDGEIIISALATFDEEAFILKIESHNTPKDVNLFTVFGGVTGTRFSRDGDIGADPESSFYLQPAYCANNSYRIDKNTFKLFFGEKYLSEDARYEIQQKPVTDTIRSNSNEELLTGIFPAGAVLQIGDAKNQQDPLQLNSSKQSNTPVVTSKMYFTGKPIYFYIRNGALPDTVNYEKLPDIFRKAESHRSELASRIIVNTPDPYINTLGGALAIAADAVWESPSYLHGAVAWRMRLPGWRGPYLADVLGWHDRAKTHFSSYALSQITEPATGPIEMDTALHLARAVEKMGTSLFSSGYISRNPGGDKRPHHYDMNLVFIDELLNHFLWTGDTSFVRTMWPLLKRHLSWEDRNFDSDGDNLYDAYAAIWASDALQYSGGDVTHSSAYNYKAYYLASQLAPLAGEDGKPYRDKANRILEAINSKLWMTDKGVYAEYKDLLGNKLLHPAPAIWTIYHAIDSKVPDQFQAYQSLEYIDYRIPHIPVRAKGLNDTTLYTISTTNWQPYTWSLNNVSLGECMHTALAYWQGGRPEEAFKLWKGSLVESMYLGASPGNFQQLSFYDAMRGELYRDFADDIGTTARSLVEGLFGIFIDKLHDTLFIHPGFPAAWNHASIVTPDISYEFKRKGRTDHYSFNLNNGVKLNLALRVSTEWDDVSSVTVNGKNVKWRYVEAIEKPAIFVNAVLSSRFNIQINWKGKKIRDVEIVWPFDAPMEFSINGASFLKWFDPQGMFSDPRLNEHKFSGQYLWVQELQTFFLQIKQRSAIYWLPLSLPEIQSRPDSNQLPKSQKFDKINLNSYFNDKLTNIFKNQYLSPRPKGPTLQLPTQGIGNWAYPLVIPNIVDSGLRQRAGIKNEIIVDGKIPFATPSAYTAKNILFTSQWDNYPDSAVVLLSGKASHAYLLMAGSTNPMQSRMVNGEIIVRYKDGSENSLQLKNPENWWPIEQDYYDDGFAFTTGASKPLRVYFKTGEDTRTFNNYVTIRGFTSRGIDGGAGTVLDLRLDETTELQSLTVKAIANDVVIGLMSVTLLR